MPSRIVTYILLLSAALVAILSFSITGPYNMRIDGHVYIGQIEQFESGVLVLEPYDVALRAFKPFYGVVGAYLTPLFSEAEAMEIINLFFLFGLPFASYFFLREFGFSPLVSAWGSVWITAGYPVLKYGLAIGTDIGGWFFAVLTCGLVLKGIREKRVRTLILASLVGFIGGTIKEPGVMGLIFGGLYLLFTYAARPLKDTVRYLSALAIPACILEGVLIGVLLYAGFPSFFDWFSFVRTEENIESHYQFIKLLGVEASAFHLLAVYALVGVGAVLRTRVPFDYPKAKIIALALATTPALLWTIFISRVLYVQFIALVPLALIGCMYVEQKYAVHAYGKVLLYSAPVIVACVLYSLAGTGSLFTLLVR